MFIYRSYLKYQNNMCWIISLTILYLSRHLWVTPIRTHTLQALQHSEITVIENMSNLKDDNWKVGIFYEVTDRCYRLCGHHVDVHTDLKSTRTERQSDQSTPDLLKAVPTGECNRANIHNGDGVLEPLQLQLPRFEIVPAFLETLKVA